MAYIVGSCFPEGGSTLKKRFSAQWATQLMWGELAGVSGTVGVVATDLGTGESASINPDREFPAASVAKIPIAMCVLYYVTLGTISLDDRIAYQSATDYENGAGSIQFGVQDGDTFTVRFLLDRMIVVSDNIARNMLERYIGSDSIREYMLALGVQPPYYAPEPRLTARGINTLLLRLDRGDAGIRPDLTQFLIGLMIPEQEAANLIATLAAKIFWYEDWLVTSQ